MKIFKLEGFKLLFSWTSVTLRIFDWCIILTFGLLIVWENMRCLVRCLLFR